MWKKITAEKLVAESGRYPDVPTDDTLILVHDDEWILVRNSQGFYAAVNQLTINTRDNLIRGYSVTPEKEELLISDETLEWIEISILSSMHALNLRTQ